MKFAYKILPFLVVAMLIAIPSFAQTGNLHGKVTDPDGKPMTGATISIDRQGITQHFEVKTDNKGQFLHAGLPTGQYQVSVMKDGKWSSPNLATRSCRARSTAMQAPLIRRASDWRPMGVRNSTNSELAGATVERSAEPTRHSRKPLNRIRRAPARAITIWAPC